MPSFWEADPVVEDQQPKAAANSGGDWWKNDPVVDEQPVSAPQEPDEFEQSRAQQEIEQNATGPEWANKAANAVVNTAQGFIPHSFHDVAGLLTPATGSVDELMKAWRLGKDIFTTPDSVEQATRQYAPERLILADAEKTPAGSQERYNAATDVIAQMLMAGSIAKGLKAGPHEVPTKSDVNPPVETEPVLTTQERVSASQIKEPRSESVDVSGQNALNEVVPSGPNAFRAMSEAELQSALKSGRIQSQSIMALPIEKKLGLTAFGDNPADVGMYTNLNLQQHGKSYLVEVKSSPDLRSDWTELPELLARQNELATESEQLKQTIGSNGPEWENRKMFTDWLAENEKELGALNEKLSALSHPVEGDLPKGVKLPYRQTPKGVGTDRITRIVEVTPQGERDVTAQFLTRQPQPGTITSQSSSINDARQRGPATSESAIGAQPASRGTVEQAPSVSRSNAAMTEGGLPSQERFVSAENATGQNAPTPTSTKNAVVDAEREARGIQPAEEAAKRDFGTAWDEAEKEAVADPSAPQRLVQSINDNPRALTDKENAMLLRRQIEVQNEHDAAIRAVNEAPNEASRMDAQARLERARNDVQAVYDAGKAAGTETGRGLNARKMLANADFTLAKMEAETRAVANGGKPLSPKQSNEVRMLHARIAQAESKLAAYEARDEFKAALRKANREARKPGFKAQSFLDQQAQRARERIIARRGKMYADPIGVTQIAHLADEAIIGASHIARGLKNFAEWSREMVAEFGERIKPFLRALFAKSQELHSEAARLAAAKNRAVTQTVQTLSKIGREDFASGRPPPVRPDRELLDLRANLQRAKDEYSKRLERQRRANLPFSKKAAETFVRAERAIKLTGITTLGKLGGAGVTRLVTTPIEETVGAFLSKSPILRRVAEAAPREGGFSAKAELAAPTKGFARGVRNIPKILKGERPNEEAVYGKHSPHYESGSVLDIPGRIHGAIKSPFKEAERERSTIKRQIFEQKRGGDPTEAATELDIGKAAQLDAQRAIFMQDNILSDWFRAGVRTLETNKKFPAAGFYTAKVANFLFPIVKVPTNVALESGTHIFGTATATGKLISVMKRGLSTIKPEEADMIMRHYKKGMVGAALFFTGYFNAGKFGGFYQPGEKRPDGDVKWGSARIAGVNVPAWLLHAPAFIVLQAGATAYRMQHRVVKGEEKGKLAGVMAAAEGLAHEIPFVNEMGRIDKLLADGYEGTKSRGDLLRSTLVPQGVQNVAAWMDPVQQRKPKTELDYLKMGIPGLREQVEQKVREHRTNRVKKYLQRQPTSG